MLVARPIVGSFHVELHDESVAIGGIPRLRGFDATTVIVFDDALLDEQWVPRPHQEQLGVLG